MAEKVQHTEAGQRRLMATIAQRFNSGKYSDLTITCGSRSWQVHRNIVCFESNFFATACDGHFPEAQQRKIDLPEDDPKIVNLVLQYLYKLDYNDGETFDVASKDISTLNPTGAPAENHLPPSPSLIAAATEEQKSMEDQVLGLEGLEEHEIGTDQTLDLQKIHSRLLVNTAVYTLADRFNLPELKALAAVKFEECASHWPLHDFATIASAVLDSTPSNDRGLRPVVVKTCENHIQELLGIKNPESMLSVDSKEWEKILIKDAQFLYSILRQKTAKTLEYEECLGAQNAQLVAEVAEQKEEKDEVKRKYKTYKSQLSTMLESAMRDNCRHCRAIFRPRFEPVLSPPPGEFCFSLRCAGCRTRH